MPKCILISQNSPQYLILKSYLLMPLCAKWIVFTIKRLDFFPLKTVPYLRLKCFLKWASHKWLSYGRFTLFGVLRPIPEGFTGHFLFFFSIYLGRNLSILMFHPHLHSPRGSTFIITQFKITPRTEIHLDTKITYVDHAKAKWICFIYLQFFIENLSENVLCV